ncbi:hypothetical protein Tco_1265547 [Tanacetum coccineum]
MHNNIMAAGLRDRPPMLATIRYAQWQSRFMRYVNTKPNGAALKKCILQGPYVLSNIILPEDKAHYNAEAEAIHLILTGIREDIYSTIVACKIAHDMWIAIKRFTSRDGESIESYYSKFYKMMNEMQTIDLYKESYHKLFDILKQYQKEVNEIRAEKIARTSSKRQRYAKNLGLIAKCFKKLYKPTNNNHRTSSNSINKNVDTTLRYTNDNKTGQFGNQRTMTVVGARETVVSQEFGHFAKECRKPKRAKDYTYQKEKMLLCKQAEKGVLLQAGQSDWLEDTNEEIDEQELEAHYMFSNERQHSEQPESINDTYVVEHDESNVIPNSSNMCDNDNQADQNVAECDDERATLANLTLDTEENKKIQKQLKKENASLALE